MQRDKKTNRTESTYMIEKAHRISKRAEKANKNGLLVLF